jgi:hypothetical protein
MREQREIREGLVWFAGLDDRRARGRMICGHGDDSLTGCHDVRAGCFSGRVLVLKATGVRDSRSKRRNEA